MTRFPMLFRIAFRPIRCEFTVSSKSAGNLSLPTQERTVRSPSVADCTRVAHFEKIEGEGCDNLPCTNIYLDMDVSNGRERNDLWQNFYRLLQQSLFELILFLEGDLTAARIPEMVCR